jgi:hypothetical protein
MARKRRTSKKLGDFYLIILAIVIFIIIKIIEAIKAVPWQFWVGAFCVLFLFFTYRYKKTTGKPEKPTVTATPHPTKHTSPVHREPPRAAFTPSHAPSHSKAIANADTKMQPEALPHQQPNPNTEDLIKVSASDLMISGVSTPFEPTTLDANSFANTKPDPAIDAPPASLDFDDDVFTVLSLTNNDTELPAPEFSISFSFGERSPSVVPSEQNVLFTPSELMPAGPSMVGRWMSPGEEITLAGLKISGGMFYVGNTRLDGGLFEEPSLIDPQALVTIKDAPSDLPLHGYYPSYKNLTADAKKRYLQWMANGRKDPQGGIALC